MWSVKSVGQWDIHPRLKKVHFNAVLKRFTSQELRKNEFTNTVKKDACPEIVSLIQSSTPDSVFEEDHSQEGGSYDSSIGSKNVEIQWHQASVEEHTDDVELALFKLVVLGLKRAADTKFDTRPVFSYHDYSGKKHSERLNAGDVVIFNPRKKHSMAYYGAEYLVAMVDVYRKR